MTRKDYSLIAEAIKQARMFELSNGSKSHILYREAVIDTVVSCLKIALKNEGYRFDSDKFVKACSL